MDRLSAMQGFVRVVEHGSFVRAAERLGWSTSSLSRLVADLEAHLGARLLQRTTRRLSLTDAGQAYFERCVQLLADLEEAEAVAGASAMQPRGTLRLTCSYHMGIHRLAPAISRFVARHPEVRFDVSVGERVVDLVEEGYDLALRVGGAGSDLLVARRLGRMQLWMSAAPAYLAARGRPTEPEQLANHVLLSYANASPPRVWRLSGPGGQERELAVRGPLHANSGEVLLAAAVAGLGVSFEPDFMVRPLIATEALERVLPEWSSHASDILAVYPSRRHLSAKVRLFVEHLQAEFAADALHQ
jgi:DNA-binding transcriptional LysR family regulator